jgi:hypothetical protein
MTLLPTFAFVLFLVLLFIMAMGTLIALSILYKIVVNLQDRRKSDKEQLVQNSHRYHQLEEVGFMHYPSIDLWEHVKLPIKVSGFNIDYMSHKDFNSIIDRCLDNEFKRAVHNFHVNHDQEYPIINKEKDGTTKI